MEAIKVLIVDDHAIVREGLRAMLSGEGDIQVVGEARDGQEAVDLSAQLHPSIVLMDVRMPGIDGIDATRRIKEQNPEVCVLMLSVYDNDVYVINSVLAGAGGYLLKDASRELLCHTIRAVASGGILIKSSLLREAVASLAQASGRDKAAPMRENLTPREQEVLQAMAQGLTNRAIAQKLFITEETAKKHVQSIIGKLEASDRTDAAVKAVRAGLVK